MSKLEKKITKEDLFNYINKQPDDRPINFSENSSDDSCGCLMVHYLKDLGYNDFSCGLFTINYFNSIGGELVLSHSAGCFISECIGSQVKNYKELKEYLTN